MTTQQLALGTAQFGLDYGITNGAGQVPAPQAALILDAAWNGGIGLLDTASAYGTSEASLGAALQEQPGRAWRIITKTLPLRQASVGAAGLAAVARAFDASLAQLRTPSVDTLMVHHAQDLLVPGGDALYGWLRGQQDAGRVRRLGVSVYGGEEAVQLMDRFAFDVVQLPASIADQRLLRDGTAARLAAAGVEVHVRSIYLQGLLLAEPAFIAARFPAQAAWANAWRAECLAGGLSPVQACISFFRSQSAFRVAVIGATSAAEVASLLAAWQQAPAADWSRWAVDSIAFIDPREWNNG